MNKKLSNLVLFVIAAYLFVAIVYIFTPATIGQSGGEQCEQQCIEKYKQCRMTPKSKQNECQQKYSACKSACGTGTNGNGNSNANTNTNANMNMNHNSGL